MALLSTCEVNSLVIEGDSYKCIGLVRMALKSFYPLSLSLYSICHPAWQAEFGVSTQIIMSLISFTPRLSRISMAVWLLCIVGLTHIDLRAQVSVKIVSSVGNDFDYFGEAVSIDGDFAVVGSWLDDNLNGKDAGAARIYRRVGAAWQEEQVLLSGDGEAGDQFGFSVAINDPYIFIGAHRDDNENGPFAGAVYVFENQNSEWVERARLVAPDGGLDNQFGASVASRGNRLIVGAPGYESGRGAAYVYHLVQTSWQYVDTIEPLDGQSGDTFGSSVSIEGELRCGRL